MEGLEAYRKPPALPPSIPNFTSSILSLFRKAQEMAKRQTSEFWQQHLEAWKRSGLTQVAYCASHGLRIKSFGRWRSKTREAVPAGNSLLTLIPISVAAPVSGGVVQIHSPGGWRIELPAVGATLLADLLRQLP